jgi:hypothetical protein
VNALEQATRDLMDDLLEEARMAGTVEARLAAAIGPCTVPGGRQRHLEIVREIVEKTKANA